ncbi:MAG: TrkA C-terminal domain-containing protein, partial [Coriobacteriia bacterium]
QNEWLFDKDWGVDVPVSSPAMLYGLIGRDLVLGNVVPLLDLRADDVAVEEVTLPADAGAVGGTLADVSLPANVSVIAVIAAAGAGVLPARGETPLGAGDVLLLLTQGALDEEAVLRALGITPPAVSDEA